MQVFISQTQMPGSETLSRHFSFLYACHATSQFRATEPQNSKKILHKIDKYSNSIHKTYFIKLHLYERKILRLLLKE
ncbi:hypothetical protein ACQRA4_11205 [Desulfovibrio sp. SGI.169]